MNYYLIAKFIHIVGALGVFITLGVEWFSLRNLQQAASTTQVDEWSRISKRMQRFAGISMAAILISGFYMMAVAHIGAAWLIVAFGALIVLGLLATLVTGRRMAAIHRLISTKTDKISRQLYPLLHQPLLEISLRTRIAIALSIIFLMTTKPDLVGSLLAVGIATLLGLISSLGIVRREQTQEDPAG